MPRRKRARERVKTVPGAPFKVARNNSPTDVHPRNYEDSEEDLLPKISLGSPTLPSGSHFRDDSDKGKPELSPEQKKLFSDLLNALHSPSHKKYGSFASCEGVKYSQGLIMRSFHVEGAGELQVPLSGEDVSKLRGVHEKQPCLDVDVCKKPCLEIDASKISFVGAPKFMSNTIQPLAMHAVRKLGRHGAAVPLAVQLHKLFLCDQFHDEGMGKWYPFHRQDRPRPTDTGEEKGLIACLVLQIPTEDGYEGGDLVVRHRSSMKTFDCHLVSSVGFCYTVFFADSKREWKKVESGTRLCMIFNLFRQDSSVQAVHRDFVACKVREVESALQPWLSGLMKGERNIYSPKLAIPLSYSYGKDELFFDEVKGDDKIVLEVLKTCRDENGKQLLDLHLCLVPAYMCGDMVTHSSSPGLVDLYCSKDDPSGHCDRHHGDGDEDNYHDGDWTMEPDGSCYGEDILGCYGEDILGAFSDDQAIVFWTGEEDNLTRAFGHLGLDKREVVVREWGRDPEEDKERTIRHRLPYGYCRRMWYRAILVLWPKELSISVFCETKLSLALDLLQSTVKITDPEFCKHLLRILCWCDTNASRVWAMDCKFDVVTRLLQLCRRARDFHVWRYDCNADLVTPTLLQLCTRARQLNDVLPHVLKLLAKGDNGIGIISRKVAKEVAAVIKVYEWTMCSSLILEFVKEWALLRGRSSVRLAYELFLIDLKDVGTIVAETIIEVFEVRITELEGRTEPTFTWCQPQAKFSSNAMIEDFLKGPQERLILHDYETEQDAYKCFVVEIENVCVGVLFNYEVINENGSFMVELQKTCRHFEMSMEYWESVPDQLLTLRTELRRIKSALQRVGAVGVNTIPNVDGEQDVQIAGEFSEKIS